MPLFINLCASEIYFSASNEVTIPNIFKYTVVLINQKNMIIGCAYFERMDEKETDVMNWDCENLKFIESISFQHNRM